MRNTIFTALASAALASAAHAAPTVIDADTTLAADHTGPIVITAPGVTLDCAHHGVWTDGSAPLGIDVRADDVTITRCAVIGFAERGIATSHNPDRLTLTEVAVNGSATGVHLSGGQAHVADWVFVQNAATAVRANDVRDTVLSNVQAMQPTNNGIELMRSVDSEVSDAEIVGAGRYGITAWSGYRVTLRDNRVDDAIERGISAGGTVDAIIEGNTISYSGDVGLHLLRSTRTTIEGNAITHSASFGLQVSQSTVTTLTDNIADDGQRAGYSVWQSVLTRGAGNTAQGNASGVLRFEGEAHGDMGPVEGQ